MEIEQIDGINISIQLLQYFRNFNDFQYNSVYSIIENLKKIYKVSSFDAVSQILYVHKLLSFLLDYIQEITSTNQPRKVNGILNEIIAKKYSSLILNHDRLLEVNSMVYLYKNYKLKNTSNFELTLSNFSIQFTDKESKDHNKFLQINKKLFLYGLKTLGRLDIYVKCHILKQLSSLNSNSLGIAIPREFIDSLNKMEKDIYHIITTAESSPFTEEKYMRYVEIFLDKNKKKRDTIKEMKKLFIAYQNVNEEVSLKLCEKLFIQLLGHDEKEIRDEAVKCLNMLYDETNWQEKESFKETIINTIGEQFKFEVIVRKSEFDDENTILITCSPSYNSQVPLNIISWNSFSSKESFNHNGHEYIRILFDLKDFSRCGYYDWNLVKFLEGRFTTLKTIKDVDNPNELRESTGRFIVLEDSIRDLTIHEVFTDLLEAQIDKDKGKIIKRGNFKSLEKKLNEFNQRYINCLYIMGALERDNQIYIDEKTEELIDIGNPDGSPMSVICRSTISKLLGGDNAFNSLIEKAKKYSMKIIVDSLARISSSRAHRRYKKILLNFLDEKGKVNLCYGTDGISTSYEDTALLNYRKLETWDLLVEDILNLALKYDIDGVHLDNCQAWPQIMKINMDEMSRLDSDLKPAYSMIEIMDGEIVYRDEDCGYWESETSSEYPNPILVKLSKKLWKICPRFIIIGECWMTSKSVNRHINLAKSGIIPRLYTLPRTLSSVFGRKIHKTGQIELATPADVNIFKEWIEENNKDVPKGTVFIQSSCGFVWPYPSLLYGRGNWAAVDMLFTLSDVPMTFMGEIEGESYRVEITNLYLNRELPKTTQLIKRAKSFIALDADEEENHFDSKNVPAEKIGKVKSLVNVSAVKLKDANKIKENQEKLIKEIGPEFGFDLTKIKFHYDHRMKMRRNHECLRRGKLVYLNAYDSNNNPHSNVFAFARSVPEETGIIAINFKNYISTFQLDLKNLINLFDKSNINFNTMCYIEDWIIEEKGDYYFLLEVISEGYMRTLTPFSSLCFGIQLIENSKENFKFTLDKSVSRMINIINNNGFIDNCRLAIQLKEILDNLFNIEDFTYWYTSSLNYISKYNISMITFIHRIKFIKENTRYATTFFQYCFKCLDSFNVDNFKDSINSIINSNILGPIVFVTPELGRWSTIGGLGVMVDELTQGLATIGQDVVVITPYYERNRKGESGYLSRDPVEFKHIGNITINLDNIATFGIHFGVVNNVKIYFLHNYDIFPTAYAEGNAAFVLKQIAYFSKASLECCCFLKIIPAVVLTNDWFTGLVAAYSKNGHFGETFRGTTFFHIVHNLEPTYEGRLFPAANEGTLDIIHKLPSHLLVDPFWQKKVINPSRCAIMSSDQWGTVSPSYRKELLETSPLNSLLKSFKDPFAFPNGVFRAQRLKNLRDKVGLDHLAAKAILQKKYFKYQELDESVPIFAFVGRITQQKGVILILEAAEGIINKYNGKVNILVGGMGNPKDPYCINCINKINYLTQKYPFNFWANPNEFFTDGPTVNVGADFGLMPSVFEPGGIVQHEFFIAGTPVLAFTTGGLRDTVFEYDYFTNKGNGVTFQAHNIYDFMYAIDRAVNLFRNKEKYEMCRKIASQSAVDVLDVAREWNKEFFRLRNKISYNHDEINMEKFSENIQKNIEKNQKISKEEILKFDFSIKKDVEIKLGNEARVPFTFSYKGLDKTKLSSVQICGSFDKWQVRHPLSYDALQNKWSVTLKIKKGIHFYKYIVDGEWCTSNIEKCYQDLDGIINNTISI